MEKAVILTGLLAVVLTYIAYSRYEGSWFNILTPQLLITVPTLYLAQLVRLDLELDARFETWAWIYVYACYGAPLIVFALTVSLVKVPTILRFRPHTPFRIGSSPMVLLLAGVVFYLPIAVEFRSDILNPRAIYEQTRTGYGLGFFLSTTSASLAFVLFLFKRAGRVARILFFLACSIFSIAHGSKGQVILLSMIWLMYWRYAEGGRLTFKRFVLFIFVFSLSVPGLFYFFSNGVEIQDLGHLLAAYSDYTANGLTVVQDERPALFGKLFMEDNFYSRIPRALFADKPKDFGSFYLAKLYFPESFDLDQGVPAFGVGVLFADFRWLTLPFLCATSFLSGLLTNAYRRSLSRHPHPSDFVVFAFLSGVPLLSLGVGYLLIEHLAIAWLLAATIRDRHWLPSVVHRTAFES